MSKKRVQNCDVRAFSHVWHFFLDGVVSHIPLSLSADSLGQKLPLWHSAHLSYVADHRDTKKIENWSPSLPEDNFLCFGLRNQACRGTLGGTTTNHEFYQSFTNPYGSDCSSGCCENWHQPTVPMLDDEKTEWGGLPINSCKYCKRLIVVGYSWAGGCYQN